MARVRRPVTAVSGAKWRCRSDGAVGVFAFEAKPDNEANEQSDAQCNAEDNADNSPFADAT